jgi:hypothetical protein
MLLLGSIVLKSATRRILMSILAQRRFFRECSRGFLQLMRVCDSSFTLSKNVSFSQSGLYGGSPMRRTRSAKRGSDRNGSQSGSTLR